MKVTIDDISPELWAKIRKVIRRETQHIDARQRLYKVIRQAEAKLESDGKEHK